MQIAVLTSNFGLSLSPTTIFAPRGTPAHLIFGLSLFVLAIAAAIFLVVASLLVFALFRFRQRSKDHDQEPAQIYGSNQIELSWTVIPLLIVVVLFLTTTRVILNTAYASRPSTAVDVVVVGHQFWWEFRYPKLGIVTANELHIPVSSSHVRTPIYLEMSSADTDHSFWVPRLAGKTDVIPNRTNRMWIDTDHAGLYLGQCAQYCGTQHAKMLLRVYGDSQEEFSEWAAAQQKPARQEASAASGEAVFLRNACVNCHTIQGTLAAGKFGPNLTHFASRDTFAAGTVPNISSNVKAWVDNPAKMKPGCLMPPMHLNPQELNEVTAYLATLQ